MLIAEVALADGTRSFDRLYDYAVPENMETAVPGMRVLVPFGHTNRLRTGWIVTVKNPSVKNPQSGNGIMSDFGTDKRKKQLKAIHELADEKPLLNEEMLKLAEWMKTRYFCTYGDAFRIMVPAGAGLVRDKILSRKDDNTSLSALSPNAELIFQELKKKRRKVSYKLWPDELKTDAVLLSELIEKRYIEVVETFSQKVNEKTVRAARPLLDTQSFEEIVENGTIKSIYHVRIMEMLLSGELCTLQDLLAIPGVSQGAVASLQKKGWLELYDLEVERSPFELSNGEMDIPPTLTEEQKQVLDRLKPLLKEERLEEALLFGITGSGKTEVYLRLIEEAIKKGKSAIVMVPEISLTPQMTGRFTGRFGSRVAIQHSRLSQGERFDQWRKIKNGEVDVVIGARSAVFAPLDNLGVIIVDEEHELTYKSEITPKYDARQIARARCHLKGALLLLGSATPSVETYYRALSGKLKLAVLKKRANALSLPQVLTVDMREELKAGNRSFLSARLEAELLKNQENREQSILFLNRRGYASFLLCRDCGFVSKCPNCSVSLTLHAREAQSVCHYCGFTEKTPKKCPKCGSSRIKSMGTGTQRIEEELLKHPGGFKVLRMDLDTTSGKEGHQKLLEAFRKGDSDVLIGTQMVAKGHDFPNVTLVGILAADATLFGGDYRSAERTFQLVTQAAGRAGRGEKAGRVVVQAYNIDDYAVGFAMAQDYEAFYQTEIKMRKEINCPPFTHIGTIVVQNENGAEAQKVLSGLRLALIENDGGDPSLLITEVMKAPVFILRNKSRYRLILKHPSVNRLVFLLNRVLEIASGYRSKGTDVSVDIDPASML